MEGRYRWFSYILLFSQSVMLVSLVSRTSYVVRECVVVEEKNFPPLVCDRLVLLFCLGVFSFRFITRHSPPYRHFAVIRLSTIAYL